MKNLIPLIKLSDLSQVEYGELYFDEKVTTPKERKNMGNRVRQLAKRDDNPYRKTTKILKCDFNTLFGYESES